MFVKSVVYFVLMFSVVKAVELPKYIKTCKADQHTLNECALKNAREALSEVIKGDQKINVPKLNPLTLPLVEAVSSPRLKLVFHNLSVFGIETVDIKSMDIDLKNCTLKSVGHINSLTFFGPFETRGQILVLPVNGTGEGNLTLINAHYTFSFDWTEVDNKGKTFMNIEHELLTFEAKDAYYHLTGLFNNDKKLGDHMNAFLNENSKEVTSEIGPSLIKTVQPVLRSIYKSYMEAVPIDIIFPPK